MNPYLASALFIAALWLVPFAINYAADHFAHLDRQPEFGGNDDGVLDHYEAR